MKIAVYNGQDVLLESELAHTTRVREVYTGKRYHVEGNNLKDIKEIDRYEEGLSDMDGWETAIQEGILQPFRDKKEGKVIGYIHKDYIGQIAQMLNEFTYGK